MASNAQKLSAAAEFIDDAPPGEMNEVLSGTSPSPWAELKAKIFERFLKRSQTMNSNLLWENTIQSN